MYKRLIALLMATLMVCALMPVVSADDSGYNDTIIDWSEHTTHVYDSDCDRSCNVCGALRVTNHNYTSAVTTEPSGTVEGVRTYTCSICGDSYTESIATLNHNWTDATCTAPKTCATCGTTEGEALGHVYTYPCDSSCDVCDATRDASHDWMDATCTAPRICRICGSEDGEALGHTWSDATCTAPKTCATCGITEGETLEHTYDNACDAACNECGATRQVEEHVHGYPCSTVCIICGAAIEPYGHQFDNGCDTTCNFCDFVREVPHTYANDCDAVCTKCGATREVPDHVWVNGSCDVCDIASPTKVEITKESATAAYAKLGAKVSVKVTAEGEGLVYTWYIKNDGGSKYSKSSVTSATYSTTMSAKVKGRRVYCIVTDRYGNSVRSKTFLLRQAASITKEPATTAYAKKSAKVSIKITASGDGLKYAWYIKNSGKSTYTKSSLKTATYSATMSSAVKGRKVYCVVTDKYGKKVQSKTFLLRECVSIVTQPKTVTVKKNATAKVTVKASGDGLKYTWYIKNAGASKYTKSSLKTATYSAKMTNTVKNRLVYCVVTDKYGKTVKTVTVKLKMK